MVKCWARKAFCLHCDSTSSLCTGEQLDTESLRWRRGDVCESPKAFNRENVQKVRTLAKLRSMDMKTFEETQIYFNKFPRTRNRKSEKQTHPCWMLDRFLIL